MGGRTPEQPRPAGRCRPQGANTATKRATGPEDQVEVLLKDVDTMALRESGLVGRVWQSRNKKSKLKAYGDSRGPRH